MSSQSRRDTGPPAPPARVRATKPTRHSSASMPLYSASPPLTPPRILSVRLRRSCGRGGGPGGGGGGAQAGGWRGGGAGGVGGGADVMARSLPTAHVRNHQGTPPSDPGSSSGVIPRVGWGSPGATIVPMTTVATGAPPRPPLERPRAGRVVAGVAAETAAPLRQDPLMVRVAFAVLAPAGIGIVAYMLLWFTMPVATAAWEEQAAAERPAVEPRTRRQWVCIIVLASIAAALLGQLLSWGSSDVVLPLILAVGGLAVIWRQLDADRALDLPAGRWAVAGGVAVAPGGVVLLLARTDQLTAARDGFAATLVILIGIVLATAPL